MCTMRTLLLAASALVLAFGLNARANELDNEKTVSTEQIQAAQALPKTVVVRIKAGTNQAEVLHINDALAKDEATKMMVSTSSFTKLDASGKMAGELDKDSSSSSWYFCCPNYYYPTYYYWGYQYTYVSYYSYYYAGYYYNYYGWPHCNPYAHYGYGW